MDTNDSRSCRLEDLINAKARRDLVRAELTKWVRAQSNLPGEIQALLAADAVATADLFNAVNERQSNVDSLQDYSAARVSSDFRFDSAGDRRQSGTSVQSLGRRLGDSFDGESAALGA